MKQLLKFMMLPVIIMLCSIIILPARSAQKPAASMGNNDLQLRYGSKKTFSLFKTQYNSFTKLTGNTGVWEDENKYHYTWNEGQAAFIKTAEMKKPQLVHIILNSNFETPRGIKKDSTLAELLKLYPEHSEKTEGGNGFWYVYKWEAKHKSPFINGKTFSLSFFVEDNMVKTVFLKLESEETENIPVG